MDLKETYDHIAEDWNRDHGIDDWWIEGTDKFISLLKPGDSALDLGCGTGIKSRYLMEKGLQVLGTDFSDKMIDIARREVPDGKFRVLDLKDTDKLERSFDAIFMQAVLLHVPKAKAGNTVTKISEKLKPGGYFYIAVKGKGTDTPDEEIVTENDYGYPYERFFSYYTPQEINKYFMDAGLTPVYENAPSSGKRGWVQVIARK